MNFFARLKALFSKTTFEELLKAEFAKRSRPTPLKNIPPIGANEIIMFDVEFEDGGAYSIPVLLKNEDTLETVVTETSITDNKEIN